MENVSTVHCACSVSRGECGINGSSVHVHLSKENVGWMENVSTVHVIVKGRT